MKISYIENWANRLRRRLNLPPIDACIAVFHDGTHRSVRSVEQLRTAIKQGGKIESGLSTYSRAVPAQRVIGIILVQLDLYHRRMRRRNPEMATAAAVDAGAAYGTWRWRQQK